PNSIGARWLSGTRTDEAGATCRHAPPATCAAPGAGGGMALPLAFAAARVAHRGTRVALPFRRDRHPGPSRRGARVERGEVARGDRCGGVRPRAAAAATDARAAEAFLLSRPDLAPLDLRFDLMLVAPLRLPSHWQGAWRVDS